MKEPFILHLGDCLEVIRSLPDNCIDSVVTDPPYGIRFMGKAWDGKDIEERAARRASKPSRDSACGSNGGHRSLAAEAGKYDLTPSAMRAFQKFSFEWAAEAFRLLKPGGYLLSFASPRTYHHMAAGIEMAGFEIRDQIMWVFGSGFPKSHNLAGEYEGWGTALKPAHEPICMARKPLAGTVAANVLEHGTGALNIDGCRIPSEPMPPNTGAGGLPRRQEDEIRGPGVVAQPHDGGRWPANLIHDGSPEVVALFPSQAGAAAPVRGTEASAASAGTITDVRDRVAGAFHADTGSAARFFYCPKASRRDRNEGCSALSPQQYSHDGRHTQIDNAYQRNNSTSSNHHPTVKPTALMAYLCRLVTPPGGVVLDPFMGSGSTGKAAIREGFQFIGCEMSPEYMAIAQARIAYELKHQGEPVQDQRPASPAQLDIFNDTKEPAA